MRQQRTKLSLKVSSLNRVPTPNLQKDEFHGIITVFPHKELIYLARALQKGLKKSIYLKKFSS